MFVNLVINECCCLGLICSFRGWMWLCKKLELNASYSLSALSRGPGRAVGEVRDGAFLKIIYWSLCTREKSRKPAMSRKGKCTGVSLHCIEDVCCSSLRNHCWEKGETGGATERKPRKKKKGFISFGKVVVWEVWPTSVRWKQKASGCSFFGSWCRCFHGR